MKSPEKEDWTMLLIVAGVAFVAHMFKVASNGDLTRNTLARQFARAAFTGIAAAGLWSWIGTFYELNPASAVGVAAGVAMFGVDLLEQWGSNMLAKRLGITKPDSAETRLTRIDETETLHESTSHGQEDDTDGSSR